MGLQSLSCSLPLFKFYFSSRRSSSSAQIKFPATVSCLRNSTIHRNNATAKATLCSGPRGVIKGSVSLKGTIRTRLLCAVSSNFYSDELADSIKDNAATASGVQIRNSAEAEPFRGKSGSISFYGLTHQMVEESQLISAPFKEGTGSLLWLLAPVVLILSLVLPPLFISASVDAAIQDVVLAEIAVSLSSDLAFYVGFAIFLLITNRVQRPYQQFTAKRWGLITGLKGYMTTAYFTMGLKVFAPIFLFCVTWPVLGLEAVAAVAPFLVGCLVQPLFEIGLDRNGSSCWPLVPIIFEVYRLYQLSKAANFIERLMLSMRGLASSPDVMDRGGSMVATLVTFQILGVVCLWSLMTFLLRLFPSRPVAENY